MEAPNNKTPTRVVICGSGEIATKAHVPAILIFKDLFQLVAVVDPNRDLALEKLAALLTTADQTKHDIPVYPSLSDCLNDSSNNKVDAVAICTPSSVTLDLAFVALQAQKHVLVEKPPGDWRRLQGLQDLAQSQQVSFFTAYHTAACVGYPYAQKWLQQQTQTHGFSLQRIHVTWKENVKKWHPGQVWVTQKNNSAVKGCEGVLDIAFNPVSLLVALFLRQQHGNSSSVSSFTYQSSQLVVPSNWETPIAGSFALSYGPNDKQNDTNVNQTSHHIPVTGEFAWDYEPANPNDEDEEIWTIDFQSTTSSMKLTDGGSQVFINGERVTTQPTAAYPLKHEYENLYQTFANLIATQQCCVDDTTPRLLEEIQTKASLSDCPEYHI